MSPCIQNVLLLCAKFEVNQIAVFYPEQCMVGVIYFSWKNILNERSSNKYHLIIVAILFSVTPKVFNNILLKSYLSRTKYGGGNFTLTPYLRLWGHNMSKGIGLIELNEPSDTLNLMSHLTFWKLSHILDFFYLAWGGIWPQGYTFLVLLEQGYWEWGFCSHKRYN